MRNSTVGLGVVGLGMAGGAMVAAVGTHPGVRLVAAADPNQALRARFEAGEGLPAYADLDTLLADPAVDAVYLASPHQFHHQQALAAARAGKHIVVEKPMALALDECDQMIEAADRAGVALVVGHTHGFDPAVMLIRELVASGAYGTLSMIAQWNYTNFLYRPRRPEELDTARGGGILYNQIPHQVEIARTIAARPVRSVRATTAVLDPQRPTEGSCTAILEFEDNVSASMVYSGYDHYDTDELHGWIAEGGGPKNPSHGSARRALRQQEGEAERQARTENFGYGNWSAELPPHQPHFGELIVSCAKADIRCGADDVVVYTEAGVERVPIPARPWRPGRGDVLEELAGYLTDSRPLVHDGHFGRETLRVCLAIKQSAAEHRGLELIEREADSYV
ncbi:Gfo/Idh/MocA family oxidoreductase [Arthrobacter sp. I2-34]|uniref:Gfo/Idh/MocA family oxidoreductase n=1 Tax=Arthrobacter hankyongi TaxID=2904801 RepID=A0ABS9L3U8_9MICC|nr:Gfo/Idh/MocA family oxidoreductase [Arthrobacter hankyongi]MCG2621340.1 Gfo/Idh/MocA family oxidoreductase [Arthrobacter hankyongi]